MTKTTSGWILFIVALGMMASLMANDISKLNDWSGARTPAFIAVFLAHFGTVITGFVAGKIIPTDRSQDGRVSDTKLREINNGNSVRNSNG